MKFHDFHFKWLLDCDGEFIFLLGIAAGRVEYEPMARWLYSFRLFCGLFKVEVLWTTGEGTPCE